MNYSESSEFGKDVKNLRKRVKTLDSDLVRVRTRIDALCVRSDSLTDEEFVTFQENFFASKKAVRLHRSETSEVIKMRLDTDSDTYRNKLRLVFVAVKTNDTICFVELYAKNEKSREDPTRYRSFIR